MANTSAFVAKWKVLSEDIIQRSLGDALNDVSLPGQPNLSEFAKAVAISLTDFFQTLDCETIRHTNARALYERLSMSGPLTNFDDALITVGNFMSWIYVIQTSKLLVVERSANPATKKYELKHEYAGVYSATCGGLHAVFRAYRHSSAENVASDLSITICNGIKLESNKFASGDWILPDLSIQSTVDVNSKLETHQNTFYFSYATRRTKKILGRTMPSTLLGIHPLLFVRTLQMCFWNHPPLDVPY